MKSLNAGTKSKSISNTDPFVDALLEKGLERMHEKSKTRQGTLLITLGSLIIRYFLN